jgi:Flp pilus assembly protein TadG
MGPARAVALARRFQRHERGIALAEFALMLPVLLSLFYGCIEVTRYILITQKVEKLTHTIADVTAQSVTVTQAGMNQLMEASADIMNPFGFGASGRIFVTSLYRGPGEANAQVNWRFQGAGSLSATSHFGAVGTVPTMPTSFAFDERENVIVAEVFFQFSPLISNQFFGTTTVYRQAFYKPRFGALTQAPV